MTTTASTQHPSGHADHAAQSQPGESGLEATLTAVAGCLESCLDEMGGILRGAGRHHPEVTPGPLDLDLLAELRDRVRNHGKRIRPSLAHWGFVVAGGGPEQQSTLIRVGAALELLHLFALIQDDVMDRSDTRRGRPTLHVTAARHHRERHGLGDPDLFGDSVATLAGDLALSEAALLIGATPPPLQRYWRTMTVELVEGQLLDLTHTAGRSRDEATSRLIARFKSGRYTITRPLQLGALAGGADPEIVDTLGAWGDLVGEVFAVRDDILGVWGDPTRTGKPAGDDLRSAKPTMLLAWAGEMLQGPDRALLERCDRGALDDAGVAALQQALIDSGVRERAEATITADRRRAASLLAGLDLPDDARVALAGVADAVAWRQA